ncbi:MAG: hypothetical protein KQJ78_10900 [Deltaproteobacteria bacterium]|nr:hypothetical protein [Deltaproteobacteria bacterium]
MYRFIPPERFPEQGIDPEDVPIGTLAAEDHPPFLPDRFGGNAYGLGFAEQMALGPGESEFLESLDLADTRQVAVHYRHINDILKRLGLLIRYAASGRPFYLIPRQFVAHFMVEIQALADEIVAFLKDLLSRRLRETMLVGLAATDSDLLLPEIQRRMPHLQFTVIDGLEGLTAERRPLEALVVVGDPSLFALNDLAAMGRDPEVNPESRESYGRFVAGRLYDLLSEDGELILLGEHPLVQSEQSIRVRFRKPEEHKRFLLYSHVFRTSRRPGSASGEELEVAEGDFHAFLMGLGIYHETVEGLLGGRELGQLDPEDIDLLDYQDLPLPWGSAQELLASWQRWLDPFFQGLRLDPCLPEVQKKEWEERYEVQGGLPPTLVIYQGRRRRPPVNLARLESHESLRQLAGCRRELLASYKDSFSYLNQVLKVLEDVRQGAFTALPGLELSRLKKPFEGGRQHPQFKYVLKLMAMAPLLRDMENWLNPWHILGARTPVLGNLEKLSLLGVEEGCLNQLYLVVLGHSTMARVTFGKLPETSLAPLTDLSSYRDLDEAVTVVRLYRLLSVAEAAAAAPYGRLTPWQVEELFSLYDQAIRVVTDPEMTWGGVLESDISQMGGGQAKAIRKMLKLFDLFDHLLDWPHLESAGPRLKEAMADFDQHKLSRVQMVIDLLRQIKRFVERFYAADSTARPYFFRALLSSELHGTGRLLASLGTEAGFTLLWICVHTSEKKLMNFNRLVQADTERELAGRMDKLRRALLDLRPRDLEPEWLGRLKRDLSRGRETYIHDSGLYLTLDPHTFALTPRFLDVSQELATLEADLEFTQGRSLHEVPDQRLRAIDNRIHEVGRFLLAQGERPTPALAERLQRFQTLERRQKAYLLAQVFHLPAFAANLQRLFKNCPSFTEKLLAQPVGHTLSELRLAAACKLSALYLRRIEQFQDMDLSHDLALQEFGPTAAGIVGISRPQFQGLNASLNQLVERRAWLGRILMLAVLLFQEENWARNAAKTTPPLARELVLSKKHLEDLDFLLNHHDAFRQILEGESCLAAGLTPLVNRQDPPLVEALFLLAVILAAARREGHLSEDYLERFLGLLKLIRNLALKGKSAQEAQEEHILGFARQHLAFQHYQDIQNGEAPTASLRHLLDTTRLPEGPEGEECLAAGRRLAGLDRLLKLRGLLMVTALDILMLEHRVPVPYIYRLKNLRSMGLTHYERDLYEGRRLYRGLLRLPQAVQDQLMESLSDEAQPVRLLGFGQAAELLTYANQIRLLLLGLAAGRRLHQEDPGGPVTVSFSPLARVIERKFELVNEAVGGISSRSLVDHTAIVSRLQKASHGLMLRLDPAARTASVDIQDPATLDRKIEAVRRANSLEKLKRIYHRELSQLNLTASRSLDYQERLEAAFQENAARLSEVMMERSRQAMAAEEDLKKLETIFQRAWQEGLDLPLSPDRQESLRDLFEMNVERIRTRRLYEINRRLLELNRREDLDRLWAETRTDLSRDRRLLGKDFLLLVARRFDRRERELSRLHTPAL